MNARLRAVDWAQGLLLALLLAAPWIGGAWLPRGVEALFVVSAFQLRLMDRRRDMRPGPSNWISHIRIMPVRLLPYAAMALVAFMVGDRGTAGAAIAAAILGELLVYPLVALLLGKLPRYGALAALILSLAGSSTASDETGRLLLAFAVGVTGCTAWLRGPDGGIRSMALAMLGAVIAGMAMIVHPPSVPGAWPALLICLIWALAHVSIRRRRPLPWRPWGSGARFTPRRAGLPSPPS
ncbi:hypothetical protein WG907_01835 [Sphingobium sp. AN558]|uniref:hypothetical protein n=1 Tax=Sphingobium sp. AN558 TaxID=3133442 RepID=UPI0030BE45F3